MPISSDRETRKRQLNALIILAFDLNADDELSLSSSCGEMSDTDVFEKFRVVLPDLNSHHYGEALIRIHVWITTRIEDAAAIGADPKVNRRDIKRLVEDVYVAVTKRGLMNYAHALYQVPGRMDAELNSGQIYVQQMEAIKLPDSQQVYGARCFLAAMINRDGWLSDDTIWEDDVDLFEQALLSGYRQQKSNTDLLHAGKSSEERGMALYNACMEPSYCRNIRISNKDPLDMTVEGSFQMLANTCEIGWHPDWKTMFKKQGAQDGTVA